MDVPFPAMIAHSLSLARRLSRPDPAGRRRARPARTQRFDAATAERFANLALACVHKEYPNKIAHMLNGDADVKPPRELTPGLLRLLRLALGRARALAAGAPGAALPGGAVRRQGAGGPGRRA